MPRVDLPGTAPARAPRHREPAAFSPAAPAPPAKAPARLTFVTGNAGKVAEMAALLAPLGVQVVADGRGYPEVQAGTLREVTAAGARHLLGAGPVSGLVPPFILEDS